MEQQQIEQLADAVLSAIAQKLNPQDQVEDGLIKVNGYRSVYVSKNKEDDGILYHVNAGELTFVEANAIKGRLSRVTTYTKNEGDRKTEAQKLSFYFECSEAKYRLEVGLERIAGKDLLADLATMSSEQLKKPITVAFKRGDDVAFAKVLEVERDRAGQNYEDIDSLQLLEQVQTLLEG